MVVLVDRVNESLNNAKFYKALAIFMIAVAIYISIFIALSTRYNAHPDEPNHMDAFTYFEDHWWFPELNSDEIRYGPGGTNRIFTGEIVYFIFAKINKIMTPVFDYGGELFAQNLGVVRYRVINAVSFIALLVILFFVRNDSFQFNKIGFTFLLIPQVYYIFSYANSDAWGIVISVLLFLLTVILLEKPTHSWTLVEKLLLGCLTGLVLLAKSNFLSALILPYSLLTVFAFRELRQSKTKLIILRQFALVGVVALLIILPVKVIYPLTQPNYAASVIEMKNQRAIEGLKPSNPTFPMFMLAAKGKSPLDVVKLGFGPCSWFCMTFISFYGMFGNMNVQSPVWIPITGLFFFLISILLTYLDEFRHWKKNESLLKYALIFAPITILTNLAASIYFSWTEDFQPQGRYIFPSLIAFAIMLTGVTNNLPKKRRLDKLRTLIFIALYVIGLYAIYSMISAPFFYIEP